MDAIIKVLKDYTIVSGYTKSNWKKVKAYVRKKKIIFGKKVEVFFNIKWQIVKIVKLNLVIMVMNFAVEHVHKNIGKTNFILPYHFFLKNWYFY